MSCRPPRFLIGRPWRRGGARPGRGPGARSAGAAPGGVGPRTAGGRARAAPGLVPPERPPRVEETHSRGVGVFKAGHGRGEVAGLVRSVSSPLPARSPGPLQVALPKAKRSPRLEPGAGRLGPGGLKHARHFWDMF